MRAEALKVYQDAGPAAASRATGVPAATVVKWAKARGIVMLDAKTRVPVEAIEVLRNRRAAMREELQLRMLSTALGLVQRIDQPHLEYVTTKDGPTPVHYPTAPAKAAQSYALAVAVLLDKYRLEMGEATDRAETGPIAQATGHMTDEDRQALRQWLDSGGLDQLTKPQAAD